MAECSESTGTISAPFSFALLHHDLARADQGLLVGKGDALFLVDGGEGGPEADRAGDRRHHAVGLPERRGLHETADAAADADIGIGHGDFELPGRFFVIDGDKVRLELPGLLLQKVDLPLGGQGRDAQAQMLRRGERLPPDGAGAAQHGDGVNHVFKPSLSQISEYAKGKTSLL